MKFEVFFESGHSIEVVANDEDHAIEIAENKRPRDEVAFAQAVENEAVAS